MTLSSNPCSCGGDNPSCFRCWGTGMVESPVSDSRDVAPGQKAWGSWQLDSNATQSRSRRSKPYAVCPHCGVEVRHIARHVAKVHAVGKVFPVADPDTDTRTVDTLRRDPPQRQRKLQVQSLTTCPVCGVSVKSMQKHARKTGHTLSGPFAKQAPQPSLRSPRIVQLRNGTLKCGQCLATFPNAIQLDSHMVSTHGKRATKTAVSEDPRTGGRPEKRSRDSIPSTERNLDAKYGWGGTFRDHGQFGSYPLHDSMDDESSA